MFAFRVFCSAVSLLVLLIAAPYLRPERTVVRQVEAERAPADAYVPRTLLPPDCGQAWHPPLSLDTKP